VLKQQLVAAEAVADVYGVAGVAANSKACHHFRVAPVVASHLTTRIVAMYFGNK
jgi:hypothetical protein